MFQAYLVSSGSGEIYYFGCPHRTLEGLYQEVTLLEKGFSSWEAEGWPRLPDGAPMSHYEGCDIYATHTDGRVFCLNPENEWEHING